MNDTTRREPAPVDRFRDLTQRILTTPKSELVKEKAITIPAKGKGRKK